MPTTKAWLVRSRESCCPLDPHQVRRKHEGSSLSAAQRSQSTSGHSPQATQKFRVFQGNRAIQARVQTRVRPALPRQQVALPPEGSRTTWRRQRVSKASRNWVCQKQAGQRGSRVSELCNPEALAHEVVRQVQHSLNFEAKIRAIASEPNRARARFSAAGGHSGSHNNLEEQ